MSDAPPDRMPDIRVTVMAADANPYGSAFVGWLFGQMALAGGSLASRLTGKRAPVVAADGFKFTAPATIGDELSVWAEVASQGNTSMTIATAGVEARPAWRGGRQGRRGQFRVRAGCER